MAKSDKQKKAEKGLHPEIDKYCTKCKSRKMQPWRNDTRNGIRTEIHKCPGCGQTDTIRTELKK